MARTGDPGERLRLGHAAEASAARHLTGLGYVILERNVHVGHGEIDLVAEDGDCLVFVEVRYRTDTEQGAPLETLGPGKRAALVRAVRAYLASRGGHDRPCRIDVVAVTGANLDELELVRNAIEVEDPWS
jgi:putative endonuclease